MGWSVERVCKPRVSVLQQVWHDKDPSWLTARNVL